MKAIAIDTSAYSWAARGHPEIVERLEQIDTIYLSPVALGELLAGFAKGHKTARNHALLRRFLRTPRVIVPPLTDETSERYAFIHASLRQRGSPIPTNDIWIAASAMQHGLRILTTDAHYQQVIQVIVDYVEAS